MKFLKGSCIALAGVVLFLANIGSALAIQPEEGTAFDTLKSGCQQVFPIRHVDRSRTRIVVVEKSTFCLYVLQRNRHGRVVATMATATSLGYDLYRKNGKFEVSAIDLRQSLFQRGRTDSSSSGTIFYPDHSNDAAYGAATITLKSVNTSGDRYYRGKTLLIHGNDDSLNVGGLTWERPGVTLLNEDAASLAGQLYPGAKTYVVNKLSDIGL